MQGAHQTRTQGGTRGPERGAIPEPKEMVALPLWESFPLEDRHRLVQVLLQAARRQVEAQTLSSGLRR